VGAGPAGVRAAAESLMVLRHAPAWQAPLVPAPEPPPCRRERGVPTRSAWLCAAIPPGTQQRPQERGADATPPITWTAQGQAPASWSRALRECSHHRVERAAQSAASDPKIFRIEVWPRDRTDHILASEPLPTE
jgi:hypothetical protein